MENDENDLIDSLSQKNAPPPMILSLYLLDPHPPPPIIHAPSPPLNVPFLCTPLSWAPKLKRRPERLIVACGKSREAGKPGETFLL